jgi:hypothetical protein
MQSQTYLLNLVLPEVWDGVDDDPGQGPSKVEGFVNDKGHDARGQNIVAHPCVPSEPQLLEIVELDIVLGNLLKRSPVGILRHRRQDGSRVPKVQGQYTGGSCWEPRETYMMRIRDNKDTENKVRLYQSKLSERATEGEGWLVGCRSEVGLQCSQEGRRRRKGGKLKWSC